jgi:hypothetical protein
MSPKSLKTGLYDSDDDDDDDNNDNKFKVHAPSFM